MIKTFILHFIYEQCIATFFKNIINNFSAPITNIKSMDGKSVSVIETFIENNEEVLKVVYTDVIIIESDDIGMIVDCKYGTMQEYPIYEGGEIHTNHNFRDYIKYEDIVEIFE